MTLVIVHYLILSMKDWRGLFCSGAVIGTFVAHLLYLLFRVQNEFPNLKSGLPNHLMTIPMVLLLFLLLG